MAHATARIGRDHYRTQIELGSAHTLVADEPLSLNGQNTGASPYELLIASLGACNAITLRTYADLKHWSLESLEVELHLLRENDAVVIDRSLRMVGLDDTQKVRLADIAERMPVTLTLKAGLPIRRHLL